jgi:hypothetical protein
MPIPYYVKVISLALVLLPGRSFRAHIESTQARACPLRWEQSLSLKAPSARV